MVRAKKFLVAVSCCCLQRCPCVGSSEPLVCWLISACWKVGSGLIAPFSHPQYMDRQKVQCPGNKGLTSFVMTRHGCAGDHERYRYTCCESATPVKQCRDAYTQCDYMGGRGVEYLDRHNVACNWNEVMTEWGVGTYWCGWGNDIMRVKYRCCQLY